MGRALRGTDLVVLVAVVAVLTPVALAASASLAASGPGELDPGATGTVSFTLENQAGEDQAYILAVSLPEDWTVEAHEDDGGTWKSDEHKWLWQTVEGGAAVRPSITIRVPEGEATGEYTVGATAKTATGVEATVSRTIVVGSPTTLTTTDTTTITTGTDDSTTSGDDEDGPTTPGDDEDGPTTPPTVTTTDEGADAGGGIVGQVRSLATTVVSEGAGLLRPIASFVADTLGVGLNAGYLVVGVVGVLLVLGLLRG